MAKSHNPNSPWPERDPDLRALWDQSYSASEIGRRMGGLTKNSVIGRANRLGLPPQPSPVASGKPSAPVARSGKPTRKQEIVLRAERVAAAKVLAAAHVAPVTAPRVRQHGPAADCQWPTTEGGRHILACSNPCEGRKPYCAEHVALAYGRQQLGPRTQERLMAVHG